MLHINSAPTAGPAIAEFGECRYERGSGLFHRDGEVVAMSPQTIELVELFLDVRDRGLTKEEIRAHSGPASGGSEAAISRAVHRLRKALGDLDRDAKYVRTVHGVGFKWAADTVEVDPPAERIRGHDASLVGRSGEIGVFVRLFAEVTLRAHRVVMVEGESGIGKTQLVGHALANVLRVSGGSMNPNPSRTPPPEGAREHALPTDKHERANGTSDRSAHGRRPSDSRRPEPSGTRGTAGEVHAASAR